MKRYRFVMDSGVAYDVVARDFRAACLVWEQFRLDPREIAAVECR